MDDAKTPIGEALDNLRDLLMDVGFVVRKRAPQELTLRVYPNGYGSYPLLNPRFTKTPRRRGSASTGWTLEFTTVSRRGDAAPESWLGNVPSIVDWAYIPMGEDYADYRYHGRFAFQIPTSSGSVPSAPELASMRQEFLRLREFLQRGG